jgi:hypothetical protein
VRGPLRAGFVFALLLGSFTTRGEAQSLFGPASIGGGVEGRRYEFEEGYIVHAIRQFAYPVAVLIPFGKRFSVDIGTAYATTNVADAVGRESSFSGFTDTQLRGSYVFGNDRVVTSLMVNIPTGQETQSLKEFNVTSNVASNFLLFPVNSYGNGFSTTGGVAVAVPVGSWNVGVAGSLRLNSEYQPFSDPGSTSVRYQPGLEGRIRAGADRLVGSSRLALGLTFSSFDNDQFTGLATGSGRYSPGNRLIGEANLTSPVGSGSVTAYAWDFYRTAGDNSAVTTSNQENIFTLGLSGGWPLGRSVQLQPLAEARFWSPNDGSGQLYGAGAALHFTLSPRLMFAPGGRFDFGSIKQLGTSYSLNGWGFSGLLRYNF